MKKLLAVLTFAALTLAARAADPVVVINSFNSVTVDGQPAGTVVDVLANSTAPNIRAFVLDAWVAYEKAITAKATTAAQATMQAAIDANAKDLADTKAALAKAQSDLATANAAIALLQAQVKAATPVAPALP